MNVRMEPAMADLQRLVVVYDDLGPNARMVLMRIAERLHAGREYGDFFPGDAKRWLEERQQEVADELIYGERFLIALEVVP